jgi:hypothetical protein
MEAHPIQIAVYKASRETEYGLGFYRNQAIPRYERGEAPVQDHMVIVPKPYVDEFLNEVHPRRASRLGTFTPQHLEFFWVSTPPPTQMEHHQ